MYLNQVLFEFIKAFILYSFLNCVCKFEFCISASGCPGVYIMNFTRLLSGYSRRWNWN